MVRALPARVAGSEDERELRAPAGAGPAQPHGAQYRTRPLSVIRVFLALTGPTPVNVMPDALASR